MTRLTMAACCLSMVAWAAASRMPHLQVSDRVGDLLKHPAFSGFGRLLLPWDDPRRNDPNMPLSDIGSLLPYHTHVKPAVVVSALNRMIDDASVGKRIFYTGHSEVASTEPPTFVAAGEADGIAPPATMEQRVDALRKLGTDVEYRKYPGVGHGFGLGTGTRAEGWIEDAVRFWTKRIKR